MQDWRRKPWLLLIPLLAAALWFGWGAATYAIGVRVYFIPTNSMAPVLAPGDRIIAEARQGGRPGRGEIWVFRMPTGGIGVKRVIGLPGESIEVAAGRLIVDGRPLAEPFIAGPISYIMPAVRLRDGEYFVLGDNRNTSQDSHAWGPLGIDQFLGRVMFRPWPPSRIAGLR